MLRFLGVVFLVLLVLGAAFPVGGTFNIAILFFGSCAAIVIGLIVRSMCRRL
jgi:hypothetical protein